MSAESGRHWAERLFDREMTTHEVEPEPFGEWHDHVGLWILDEGWGGAWIETDTVVEVRE